MTVQQGIVDAGTNVAHASSGSDVGGEREQALDEFSTEGLKYAV